MKTHDEDRDLRESFALQRREEETQVTRLGRLLEGARIARGRQRRPALTPVPVVAILLVVLVLAGGQALQLLEPVTLAGMRDGVRLDEWTAPTAFLLRTPGRDFLTTVPAFARTVPALNEKESSP